MAALLNSIAGTAFEKEDLLKAGKPPELGGDDGYFSVAGGWNYLVVQYGGPAGLAVVIKLDGNDAKIPFDSSAMYGSGDKYAISHFAVAGPHQDSTPVPDGGMTVTLLGMGLAGVIYARRRLNFKSAIS